MTKQEKFVEELARFLVEDQTKVSIMAEAGNKLAQQRLALRRYTNLFGYPTVAEATRQLRQFFWPVSGEPDGEA